MNFLRHLFLLFLSLSAISMSANVGFRFAAHSIDNSPVKNTMERNLSAILTEIDNAGTSTAPTFQSVNVPVKVENYFNALWSELQTPIQCVTDMYVSQCLRDTHGYQVRGLKVEMLPQLTDYSGPRYRNLVAYFDKQGNVRDIRIAPEDLVEVEDVVTDGVAVEDMAERYTLLKFVEDFRCYYNEQNLAGLEMIFSDDALIITGTAIMKQTLQNGEMVMKPKIIRTSKTKREYLDNLARTFHNNKKIDVKFEKINVVKNAGKEGFYGVTLHQSWKSDNYSDEGWVFLYWDFSDPDAPQILVRTWQDEETAEQMGVYNISDFSINDSEAK